MRFILLDESHPAGWYLILQDEISSYRMRSQPTGWDLILQDDISSCGWDVFVMVISRPVDEISSSGDLLTSHPVGWVSTILWEQVSSCRMSRTRNCVAFAKTNLNLFYHRVRRFAFYPAQVVPFANDWMKLVQHILGHHLIRPKRNGYDRIRFGKYLLLRWEAVG